MSQPSVFIVESRNTKEEKQGKRQGKILVEILTLLNKKPEYRYIRTKRELRVMVRQFFESEYRYLHLACHGRPQNLRLTLERLRYDDLVEIVDEERGRTGTKSKRRLFLSACSVPDSIAQILKPPSVFISVVAPRHKIKTRITPLVWATFYNNMFGRNPKLMKHEEIRETLDSICSFFGEEFFGYFRMQDKTVRRSDFPRNGGRS
jgi:hypothetical protein